MKRLPSLSVIFPAFNDAQSIESLVEKTASLLPQVAKVFEIIIVNDGSYDNTLQVLTGLQKDYRFVSVIDHAKNLGYGAALISGFKKAEKEFVFYTDGDGQYDVSELPKLVELMDENTDMITGFKLHRLDPWYRKFTGEMYRRFARAFLGISIRDVDCDFRLFRKKILSGLNFSVKSGAFDLEFISKLQKKNISIKEVGVYHYPRKHGKSQMFTVPKIAKSVWDVARIAILGFAN